MKIALAVLLLASGALEIPRLGIVRTGRGNLRVVFGVAGNFLAGPKMLDGVISAAFSGRVLAVETEEEVLVLTPAGEIVWREPRSGPVLFAFREDGSLARMAPRGGDVVALNEWSAVVRRGETLWLIGPIEEVRLPGAGEPALFTLGGGVLFCRDRALILRTPGGEERRVDLPFPPEQLELMGRNWVQVSGGDSSLALRIDGDRPVLFELPRQ